MNRWKKISKSQNSFFKSAFSTAELTEAPETYTNTVVLWIKKFGGHFNINIIKLSLETYEINFNLFVGTFFYLPDNFYDIINMKKAELSALVI